MVPEVQLFESRRPAVYLPARCLLEPRRVATDEAPPPGRVGADGAASAPTEGVGGDGGWSAVAAAEAPWYIR